MPLSYASHINLQNMKPSSCHAWLEVQVYYRRRIYSLSKCIASITKNMTCMKSPNNQQFWHNEKSTLLPISMLLSVVLKTPIRILNDFWPQCILVKCTSAIFLITVKLIDEIFQFHLIFSCTFPCQACFNRVMQFFLQQYRK